MTATERAASPVAETGGGHEISCENVRNRLCGCCPRIGLALGRKLDADAEAPIADDHELLDMTLTSSGDRPGGAVARRARSAERHATLAFFAQGSELGLFKMASASAGKRLPLGRAGSGGTTAPIKPSAPAREPPASAEAGPKGIGRGGTAAGAARGGEDAPVKTPAVVIGASPELGAHADVAGSSKAASHRS